ncbi:MAG TPA: Do family serine endopeptidase [Hyphomicrobiaceae bacterium]|nr:Do family serine endopeptidase [Hyphomicrobiaceae bacterium]
MSDISMQRRTVHNAGGPALRSGLRRRLLAGTAILALLAAGSGYTLHAYSADGGPFGAPSQARVPASPAAMPGFAELVRAVKPAVVSVRVRTEAADSGFGAGENPFEGTPFEKFFKRFPAPNSRQPKHFMQGQGSGFFISPDGYIVTNNHVVDNAVKVEVTTDSGASFDAKVVGKDPKTDLALIKVDGRSDFPFVKLSDTKPKIGEWVVAMGNPFGLGGTVTAGIVSAEGRDIGSGPYDTYIQIDAPVNRGNSGGPTFNLKGEVIGVNTAIYSPSGGSVGIAFDIPASTIANIIPQLQKSGHVVRGWLGVQIQPMTQEIAESLGLERAVGALVAQPQPGSPAAEAGLKAGDVITSVDSTEVKDARDLARRIAVLGPHKSATLGIIRDGKERTVNVTLGRLPEQNVRRASGDDRGERKGTLGLTLAPAADVEGAGENGLAVIGVDPDSKAAELGLQPGDVIQKAGSKELAEPADLRKAVAEAKAAGRKHVLVMVSRDNKGRYIALPVG